MRSSSSIPVLLVAIACGPSVEAEPVEDEGSYDLAIPSCGPADEPAIVIMLGLAEARTCDDPTEAAPETTLSLIVRESTQSTFEIGVGGNTAEHEGRQAVGGEITFVTGHGVALGDYTMIFDDGTTIDGSYEEVPVCPSTVTCP